MRPWSGPTAFSALLFGAAAAWTVVLASGPITECLAQTCPSATAAATRASLRTIAWALALAALAALACGVLRNERVARGAGAVLALAALGALPFAARLWLAGATLAIFGVAALAFGAGVALLLPARVWTRPTGAR